MGKLALTRPLAFFDLETTGINIASDRIVEISILKFFPPDGGRKETKTLRINPTIPIPTVVSKIHGIFDEDIKNSPTFNEVALELSAFVADCDLAGYNCNHFDIPLLMEEFLRAGIDVDMANRKFIDVQSIFHKKEERTLSAAYKFYCGKTLEKAHSAEADIAATAEILESQLDKYSDLKNDIEYLHNFTSRSKRIDFAGRFVYNDKNIPIFNFGKHSGKPIDEVLRNEPQYYQWMIRGDFSLHTKKVLTTFVQNLKKNKQQ